MQKFFSWSGAKFTRDSHLLPAWLVDRHCNTKIASLVEQLVETVSDCAFASIMFSNLASILAPKPLHNIRMLHIECEIVTVNT